MVTRIFIYCPKDGTVVFKGEYCPVCGTLGEKAIIVGGPMVLYLTPDGVRLLYESYIKPMLPEGPPT